MERVYLGIREANNVIANVPEIEMDEELKIELLEKLNFLEPSTISI